MSNATWPEGPWEIVPTRGGLEVEIAEADILLEGSGGARSYSKTVCTINFAGADQWAIARLISAAPEMAEALEGARHLLANLGHEDTSSYPLFQTICRALARARGDN